jgi:predicted lipoprotein with Yx(FWY)xxD motif
MSRFSNLVTGWSLAAAGATMAVAAVAVVILLSASGTAAAGSSVSATISLRATKLGKILVASNGHTLYAFSRDGRNHDRCAMVKGCTGVWPIVAAHGEPKAGRGVNTSLLRTIRAGRVSQVSYAGHPLYTYIADSGPGDTAYVGVSQFGGSWPAVAATGRVIK